VLRPTAGGAWARSLRSRKAERYAEGRLAGMLDKALWRRQDRRTRPGVEPHTGPAMPGPGKNHARPIRRWQAVPGTCARRSERCPTMTAAKNTSASWTRP
jgi:hypothetical protein